MVLGISKWVRARCFERDKFIKQVLNFFATLELTRPDVIANFNVRGSQLR